MAEMTRVDNRSRQLVLVALLIAVLTMAAACAPSSEAPQPAPDNGTETTPDSGADTTPDDGASEADDAQDDQPPAFPLTTTDATDRDLTLEDAPDTLVSLVPSTTDILLELGHADRIAAVDEFSLQSYEDRLPDDVQNLGGMEVNMEALVALDPDIIFTIEGQQNEPMRDQDLPVFVVQPQTIDDVLDSIALLGEMTGAQEEAAEITSALEGDIADVGQRAEGIPAEERLRVYYEISYGNQIYSVGPGSFIDDLITTAGGTNIAADADTPWPVLNEESVLDDDPQVILTPQGSEGLTALQDGERNGWESVSAVQNDRVHGVPPNLVSRPDTHVAEALRAVAAAIYPDVFGD